MSVSIELYGIPRQRAGVARAESTGARLGEVLVDLAGRYPALAETCIDGERLRPGFIANVGGDQFVNDPDTPIAAGATLLILSADAGG